MSRTRPPKWSVKIPVRARAMVLAQQRLFLAGPPDVVDPDDPYGAFEGRRGGCCGWCRPPTAARRPNTNSNPHRPSTD